MKERSRNRGLPEHREQLARTLKRAFPLPESGSFNDLLTAIDLAETGRK